MILQEEKIILSLASAGVFSFKLFNFFIDFLLLEIKYIITAYLYIDSTLE